jgi:pimeloyl-ACP methyl ester carboxylesterase
MLTREMKTVTSEEGQTVEVESGMLTVAENRVRDSGRTISIAYYRVKSTSKAPGPAFFMLAGGPGASWINSFHKEERFREVVFYRELSDVVIFDQRGAGKSIPNLKGEGRKRIPMDQPLTREAVGSVMRELATECRDYWEGQGIDLTAYNTDESAADVNDLREAFGYEKIILVGGSYGSHLGLHVMRKYPDIVDRAILYGIEGPDHTWDMPSGILEALKRIAQEAETSPYYRNRIPQRGLITALKSVVERVAKEPVTVTLTRGDTKIDVVVNEMVVQAAATYQAGKRSQPEVWPDLILAMYNGNLSMPAQAAMGMRTIPAPNAMSNAMDFASGISTQRRRRIQNDPAQEILGDINFGYTMTDGIWKAASLGDAFRENVVSDIPVLLVHGTFDTSTPIENAREVVASLKNGHLIEVVGGTHGALYNLYEHWPPMHNLVRDFMQGKPAEFPNHVRMPPLKFPKPYTEAQAVLWDAAKSGDVEATRKAIAAGTDVNALDTRRSKNGRRPLNWAAYYNHVEVIELLLANGADINATNITGFTPIHHAAENDKEKSVIVLINAGADPSIANRRGKTPMATAKEKGHKDIVRLLEKAR